jgi:putative redox protein
MSEVQSTVVTHTGKMSFEVLQNNHTFKLDAAVEGGGDGAGVRPKALILSALAGCTAMDIVSLLNKMRVAFSNFSVKVDGELTDEHPKYYNKVALVYFIHVENDADKEKMEKAVTLSQERYCGVSEMVRKFAELSFKIEYV